MQVIGVIDLNLRLLEREIARREREASKQLGKLKAFIEDKMSEARDYAVSGDCKTAFIKTVSLSTAIKQSQRLDPALKSYALKLLSEYYDEYIKPYCTGGM